MSDLASNILMVDPPKDLVIQMDRTDIFNWEEGQSVLKKNIFAVICLFCQEHNLSWLEKMSEFLQRNQPRAQILVIYNSENLNQVYSIIKYCKIFRIMLYETIEDLAVNVLYALEAHNQLIQNQQLNTLINDQNEKLKILKSNLEERIQKRQKNLEKSKRRLFSTNKKIQLMHSALIAINQARSINEIEKLLLQAMGLDLELEWLRISFLNKEFFEKLIVTGTKQQALFSSPLFIDKNSMGKIFFARSSEKPFSKEEKQFLIQLSDATSLALDKLVKLEELETLKTQWDATFNAINEPIAITNETYEIIRCNLAFNSLFNKTEESPAVHLQQIGMAAQQLLDLQEDQLVTFEKVYEDEIHIFEVSHHVIPLKNETEEIIKVVFFRDITTQKRLEKQILESSKMAELGTIGSSIAHELNNPLGGMLSYLQLIKMDLNVDSSDYQDIVEMETATRKCKEIVESLLGFARKGNPIDPEPFDLKEVIQQSIKIIDLQTRSKGINVDVELPFEPTLVVGSANQLTQAICNLLQNSIDAISEKIKEHPRYDGQIRLELRKRRSRYEVIISDNGKGIKKEILNKVFNPLFSTKSAGTNSGLGLTIAFQIAIEHKGNLEIFSQPSAGTSAKFSIPSPD